MKRQTATSLPVTASGVVALAGMSNADVRALAVEVGVCVRPVLQQVTDRLTGEQHTVSMRCRSTRASVCPSCAERARRLRMQQCTEGWHLGEDPLPEPPDNGDQAAELGPAEDHQDDDTDAENARRVRSTRRRQDVPDLPRVDCDHRSIGKTFTGRDGRTYRPSMFVTLTLPSYGKVHHGDLAGVPVDPSRYDYRRAAKDAIAFSALVDRWVQNLRRCAGYKVQYFAAVEAQKRRAGHLHLAIRGAIPHALLKQVTAATYVSQWWPPHDEADVVYPDDGPAPVWHQRTGTYHDPHTGFPLQTWDQALDDLAEDPEARPSHVARFGRQIDSKGIVAPSPDADRAVRYLTKYLTQSISDTYGEVDGLEKQQLPPGQRAESVAMAAHIDRLHAEVQHLPCGPSCANWLRYGITPKSAGPGLIPGRCPGAAHERENLGLGGRRVLASRHWSGKTLKEHAADRATVVRETLTAAGIDAPDTDRLAADQELPDGTPRFVWEHVHPDEADYTAAILGAIRERNRWRMEYDAARALTVEPGPPDTCGEPFSNPGRSTEETV